jgi:glycosyltransferase involved in cell wall biosynthesis
MRIVYPLLWSRLGRQASQEQTISTVAALTRLGHQVTLLMPRDSGDPRLNEDDLKRHFGMEGEFRLIQRPSRWAGDALHRTLFWLRQVFRDPEVRGSDLLYSRIPVMFGMGRLSPIPFATEHYRPWSDEVPFLRPWFRFSAHASHCVGLILHSDYAAAAYRRAGIDRDRLLVAHNGAAAKQGNDLSRTDARSALGLPGDRPVAVYAGRLNEAKGLDQLLAVAAMRPGILFLLVGSEGEGPIERAAAALENVRIVPWAEPAALPCWLAAADVLVIPPSNAPLQRFRQCVLPMKLFSYLAADRPILAPFSPDTAELLEHETNALLVQPDDPAAAAAALDRLIAEPGFSRRLGENAVQLSRTLTWDARAAKISAFLTTRLSAQRSAYKATVRPPSTATTGAAKAPTAAGK